MKRGFRRVCPDRPSVQDAAADDICGKTNQARTAGEPWEWRLLLRILIKMRKTCDRMRAERKKSSFLCLVLLMSSMLSICRRLGPGCLGTSFGIPLKDSFLLCTVGESRRYTGSHPPTRRADLKWLWKAGIPRASLHPISPSKAHGVLRVRAPSRRLPSHLVCSERKDRRCRNVSLSSISSFWD
eukprot:scaffold2069_cov254-Pinguiococcus_pyrenoidosus.AAC.17